MSAKYNTNYELHRDRAPNSADVSSICTKVHFQLLIDLMTHFRRQSVPMTTDLRQM